jgi:hypothetical protein
MTKLHDQVDDWLAKQGFPLEFRTARAFSAQGLRSFQGRYIRDPRTQQLREIDVIASLHLEAEDVRCRVSVVVECKWSRERPWVLFTADDPSSLDEQVMQAIASSFGEGVLWHLSSDETFRRYSTRRRTSRVGFGGRRALTDKNDKDQFYEAMQGVVGAAVSLAAGDERPLGQTSPNAQMVAHIIYPVIVIDGAIFQAHLEGDELRTAQVGQGTVLWRGHDTRDQPVAVDVVAVGSLDEYVTALSTHCREVLAYLQNPAREVRFALQSGIRSKLIKETTQSFVPVPHILRRIMSGLQYHGEARIDDIDTA